jgi:phage shock protein C
MKQCWIEEADMTCSVCGKTMDSGARFCSSCGATMAFEQAAPVQTRLYRPRNGRMIAGVCAAIAVKMGWDVALVRVVTVLLVFVGCGTALIAYLIAWIVIPNGQFELPLNATVITPPPAAPYTPPSQTGSTAS